MDVTWCQHPRFPSRRRRHSTLLHRLHSLEKASARNPGIVAGIVVVNVEVDEGIVGAARYRGKSRLFKQAPKE